MSEPPKLKISQWVKGLAFTYECSLCGQPFLTPEDQPPKEAMSEIWEAFNDHTREAHGEVEAKGSPPKDPTGGERSHIG